MVGYPPDSAYEQRMSESMRVGPYNIELLHASPMACPVCGDPTGNCVGENGPEPPDHISGYNSVDFLNDGQTYLVEEDVTEERQIAGGITITVLKYPKGRQIPLEEAKNLGLI
jgi:hypothetical protein